MEKKTGGRVCKNVRKPYFTHVNNTIKKEKKNLREFGRDREQSHT
jgi:hypothetical protein